MTIKNNGNFEVLDYSDLNELTPRMPTLLERLGLFKDVEKGTSTIAQVERIQEGEDAIEAKARGADRNFVGSESAIIRNFNVPFFPLDGKWKALDIQDLRKFGTATDVMDMPSRVKRGMDRIGRSHDRQRARAQYAALRGVSYAPNFPQAQYDYDTEFKVTIPTGTVDFTDAVVDPRATVEVLARRPIIDNAQDGAGQYRVIAIVGRGFFDALIAHPLVRDAYANYSSAQEPLRNRLGGDSVERIFTTDNVTYIEDIFPADSGIGDLEAKFIPMGIEDALVTHYAPADTIDHANTEAQEMYMFVVSDGHRKEAVETETSFIVVNSRPELFPMLTGQVTTP